MSTTNRPDATGIDAELDEFVDDLERLKNRVERMAPGSALAKTLAEAYERAQRVASKGKAR